MVCSHLGLWHNFCQDQSIICTLSRLYSRVILRDWRVENLKSLSSMIYPSNLVGMGNLTCPTQILNQKIKILIGCHGNQETIGKNLVLLGKANFHTQTSTTTCKCIFTLCTCWRVQVSIQFFNFFILRLFTDIFCTKLVKNHFSLKKCIIHWLLTLK